MWFRNPIISYWWNVICQKKILEVAENFGGDSLLFKLYGKKGKHFEAKSFH